MGQERVGGKWLARILGAGGGEEGCLAHFRVSSIAWMFSTTSEWL